MVTVRIAERLAIQVGDKKGNERGKPMPHHEQIGIACFSVLCLDQREFRHRDQDLANSLDDLLLICRCEFGQAKRLILYFDLAQAVKFEFIVNLDSGRWQQGHYQKYA